MQFTSVECFLVVMAFLLIGEVVSEKTKAYVPSVFISAVLFLIAFWTFAPKDVVVRASFGKEFIQIAMGLLLVHLGTLMSLRKLISQWKAVVVAVCGVCGIMALTMTVGLLLFDWHTVVAATPPLTGGIVAALLMSEGLKAQGITALAVLPIAMFITHSFFGYPITSWCLKKEGKRVIKDFRENGPDPKVLKEGSMFQEESERKKLIPALPKAYQSSPMILFKVILVSMLAGWLSNLTGGAVNQYVICLILGVVFCELGFLEEQSLVKAGVFNWLILGLLAYVFSQLSSVTPAQLLGIIGPIIVLIILGILGMFIMSMLVGRPLGFSKEMAFACALTALFGFPADYVITTEVCKSVGSTEEEKNYLIDILLPRMLVGGFMTVSIASVVIASIFLKLL
ncbi:hypothetical protein ACFHWD_10145 [Clostridium sp. MT-14]|uniref:Na+/glutamate symporter n=1 Tax=Clostridium aromativorans TaxID=2836848 RepID=A0ABS8N2Q8_9CLOT|nr:MULTISPECIES: hypothetical protein [Clostridium]KAA8676563.1 hypothetical protein F3O63_03140 [Clostridium sp. HV4-5-A1G]MCC9294084.1 hypothetical protein [Clostridium aromativorans]CAB1239568.1 conserved membrane hypothetical protein [Clostridiaceae bacterium BL-3]